MPIDQWCQALLDDLFANRLYPTGLEFTRIQGYPETTGTILLIPGEYHTGSYNRISENLAQYEWVLAIRTSDERDQFDPDRIYHPNIKWWVQTPRTDSHHDAYSVPFGYTPHTSSVDVAADKHLDVFLSGQVNHHRRTQCFEQLTESATRVIRKTDGFTAGLEREQYVDFMRYAKVAPCPAGVFSPDSFRVWEALQAHTIPIVDDLSPQYDSMGYWDRFHPDAPFPIITDWSTLPELIEQTLRDWPANANRITAWWIQQKRAVAHRLVSDLRELGAIA